MASQVRVAVRIRPLTPQELGQGANKVVEAIPPTVGIGERRFTYDAVFDSLVTQPDLYGSVSTPLLRSFLDGYNATIMAYGQTGSGKTFTMGSEAHPDGDMCLHPGLIPRFMSDIFGHLEKKKTESDSGADETSQVLLEYRVSASFLEVYGEDVHDLLDKDRKTLPLREDSTGGVVVAGLTSQSVSNAAEALNVLHEGTLNRTTAATLMNLTSSRSHAVFTVRLQQTCRSSASGEVDVTTTSCFTFVDLAGSERMKKTGAEGERAREGIKINEGLLALGNVINALADEERLSKEKKIHVPYRQSKLTRLLQDALGGNSQTLFLACVSPADSNASETLSTLHYANRARNIKNAPTKNVDATMAELQRLHALNHILQCELVKNRFDPSVSKVENGSKLGHVDENLMNQQEVKDYLDSINRAAEERRGTFVPLKSQSRVESSAEPTLAPFGSMKTPLRDRGIATPIKQKILGELSANQSQHFDDVLLDEVNPDEEMAILDQLLELQHHDNEYDKEHKNDEEQLKQVEGELEEQEAMLLQLRESLRVYHSMKAKYELLMGEVQQLEVEKANLADQLEKVSADPRKGCSLAIKKKLEKVEASLARARCETRKHQQMCRKAEQEAQKSKVLERKITDLKHGKVSLIKKQKEAAARHREYTETKTREIMALKRKERTAGQKVSKLQAEIQIHKNNLEKRKEYCSKLSEKLKQTESHLMKLLAMRKRELNHRTSMPTPYRGKNARPPLSNDDSRKNKSDHLFAPSTSETQSIMFLLEKLIVDLVSKSQSKCRYEDRVAEYSDVMRDMIAEVKLLNDARKKSQESEDDDMESVVRCHEQNVEDLELKLELVGAELEGLKANLPTVEEAGSEAGTWIDSLQNNDSLLKVIGNVDASMLRTLLREIVSKLAKSELERQRMADSVQRKEATLQSFNNEVDTLNNKITTLTKEIAQRRTLSEAGNDPIEIIRCLSAEKSALEKRVRDSQLNADELSQEIASLRSHAKAAHEEKAELREKLIVAETILKLRTEPNPVDDVLKQLQGIWKDLGVDDSKREDAQQMIESCLEDTCGRIIDQAAALKVKTIKEIGSLRQELTSMYSVLGKDQPKGMAQRSNNVALLPLCHSLQDEADKIRPEYKSAVERRATLVQDAKAILDAIGYDRGQPSLELLDLIQSHSRQCNSISGSIESGRAQRAEALRNVEDMVASLDRMIGEVPAGSNDVMEPDIALANEFELGSPKSLNVNLLDHCEKEVSRLRLIKSELLVQNSELRDEAAVLVNEMHLSANDIVSLMEQTLKPLSDGSKTWWSADMAQQVARTIVNTERLVLTTESFSKHLDSMCVVIKAVANGRRLLSQALKGAVDRAQKTLLMTVDGEADASEAYASFHKALFQLPPLSKEHIEACITELNALVTGVEAMTQSEVEALTVIWEALDIKSSQRGQFWSHLEEKTTAMQSKGGTLFDAIHGVDSSNQEGWVKAAVKNGEHVFRELSMRLFKLEQIHQEVETLRSKQDAKSRIISLDSEIRILSAKLTDFEETKCNKSRLLTKKSGSSVLLKEERFRKQMQGKFTSKLEQLARFLSIWMETEGGSFDTNLLSDEVRKLLDNADRMDTWVEKRTEFMHLNLNSKSTGKRTHRDSRLARSGSSESRSRSPVRGHNKSGERPTKVARTNSRTAIPPPSPGLVKSSVANGRSSRDASSKRKPEGRSMSPTKPKVQRTGSTRTAGRTPLSPSAQQSSTREVPNPKGAAARTMTEAQKLLPFGHLFGSPEPKDKENANV